MKFLFGQMLLSCFLFITFSLTAQDNVEYGIASYYSDDFHGRRTAYGEIYDKNDLTAAHKRHTHGTILKITRLDNKKSVQVRVNDKGPYIKGRVVDVSKKAATTLGLTKDGVAEVKVEVVSKGTTAPRGGSSDRVTQIPDDIPSEYGDETPKTTTTTKKTTPKPAPKTSTASKTVKKTTPVSTTAKKSTSSTSSRPKTTSSTRSKGVSEYSEVVREDFSTYGLYRIVLEKPFKRGYGVQVASLTNYDNALKQVASLQSKWFNNVLISIEPGFDGPIYKIIMGPFQTEAEATTYKASMKKKHKLDGFIINLEDLNN